MALAPALVLRRRVVRVPPVERPSEEPPLILEVTLFVLPMLVEREGGGTVDDIFNDTLAVSSVAETGADAGADACEACDFCCDCRVDVVFTVPVLPAPE